MVLDMLCGMEQELSVLTLVWITSSFKIFFMNKLVEFMQAGTSHVQDTCSASTYICIIIYVHMNNYCYDFPCLFY